MRNPTFTFLLALFAKFSTTSSREITFFLFTETELERLPECFNISAKNLDHTISELDKNNLYYKLVVPPVDNVEIIPDNYDDIAEQCNLLIKLWSVDGVQVKQIVTKLDKIMLPLILVLFTIFLGFIIYLNNERSQYITVDDIESSRPSSNPQLTDTNVNSQNDVRFSMNDSTVSGKIRSITQIIDEPIVEADSISATQNTLATHGASKFKNTVSPAYQTDYQADNEADLPRNNTNNVEGLNLSTDSIRNMKENYDHGERKRKTQNSGKKKNLAFSEIENGMSLIDDSN